MSNVPERRGKPDGEQLDTFYAILARTGRIGAAAEAAGINKTSLKCWTSPAHPRYDSAIASVKETALEAFQESLLAECHKRAVEGTDVELSYKGEATGEYVKQKSDRLLELMLKSLHPAFRQRSEIVSTNVNMDASALDPDNLTPEQLAALQLFMDALDSSQEKKPRDADFDEA